MKEQQLAEWLWECNTPEADYELHIKDREATERIKQEILRLEEETLIELTKRGL